MDAAAHRTELDPQRRRDLLVRQTLDVTEHDSRAVFRGEGVERGLDVGVERSLVEGGGRGGLPPLQAIGGVVGQGVESDALFTAYAVEKQVRGDAVQPTFERAWRVRRQ